VEDSLEGEDAKDRSLRSIGTRPSLDLRHQTPLLGRELLGWHEIAPALQQGLVPSVVAKQPSQAQVCTEDFVFYGEVGAGGRVVVRRNLKTMLVLDANTLC